jgi:uncharacterized repeat protein (TIGR03803 family)
MTKLSGWRWTCAVVLLCSVTAVVSPAQKFTTLVEFNGANGDRPQFVSLAQGADGSFFGTTEFGGSQNGVGTVFRVTREGKLTTLYTFCLRGIGSCTDGDAPMAGLVLAIDGNFYGTAHDGGLGQGTVFRITPTGALTTIVSFNSIRGEPAQPESTLIQGVDGNFYGTTALGGANYGTIFKVNVAGTVNTLHSFCSGSNGIKCPDGFGPFGGSLIQSTDGNFYGVTAGGGANSDGTIFKITPAGKLTTLYNFCSQPFCADGAQPIGQLIEVNGVFYGTTGSGGGGVNCNNENGCGTVFKMTPNGALTTLYNFCSQSNCTDGDWPTAGLTLGSDGNFYGTTVFGGQPFCSANDQGCGVVYKVTPDGLLTTLYTFCTEDNCPDGLEPIGGLLQATNGVFYGTTQTTVFGLDMGLGPFVAFVRPYGKVGQSGGILGQGFTGTTSVSLNGIPASFTVVSDTFIRATVPAGATTGYVTVVTPSGTLTSNVQFRVLQ